MKKLLLSLLVVGALSSCKKEAPVETHVTTETSTSAGTTPSTMETPAAEPVASQTTVGGLAIPTFTNPEVQQFANEYTSYINEMATAAKSGDAAKLKELSGKSQEWAKRTQEVASKLTAEDAKVWKEYAVKLAQSAQGK